jgi:uncharacterized surface protein with fasciclin (FAS1) repeats
LNDTEKKRIIYNHIIPGRLEQSDLEGPIQTNSGLILNISSNGSIDIPIDDNKRDINILTYEVFRTNENGIIHEVNGLLEIGQVEFSTYNVYDIIANSSQHRTFYSLIKRYPELVGILQAGNRKTIFAPNENAFDKLKLALGIEDLTLINPEILREILAFHIHNNQSLTANSFDEATPLSTIQGENITFNLSGNIASGGTNTNVKFTGNPTLTNNGIVHEIESVLIPPSIFEAISSSLGTLAQPIVTLAEFSFIKKAIAKSDGFANNREGVIHILDLLSKSEESMTLFLPNNEVFHNGQIDIDDYSSEQWYGLIGNHLILNQRIESDNLTPGNHYFTFVGGIITVIPSGDLDSNGIIGAEAKIIQADHYDGNNGVLHTINGVLKPAEI